MIDIELREVPSDDAPPTQLSVLEFACALQSSSPASSKNITVNDIIVNGNKWSYHVGNCSGKVEKMPHPQYPQALMEVYYYDKVSHTTLQELVDFLNFMQSIQSIQ